MVAGMLLVGGHSHTLLDSTGASIDLDLLLLGQAMGSGRGFTPGVAASVSSMAADLI